MVRVTGNTLESQENGKGQFSYLLDKVIFTRIYYRNYLNSYNYLQEADLLATSVAPTSERLLIVDITMPFAYDYYAFLIPVSDATANVNAIIKPFQWPV